MTKFKFGDRVRLTEDYGKRFKGYEGIVEKVEDLADRGMRERGILVEQMVFVEGGMCAFNIRFELVQELQFEVVMYYRHDVNTKHVVKVLQVQGDTVWFTIIQNHFAKSGTTGKGDAKRLREIWEPCTKPKVKVMKSGWIIVEHRDTLKGAKAIAQHPVFDTEEEAKKWVSDKFHHIKIESAKYHKIEWEEEGEEGDDDTI